MPHAKWTTTGRHSFSAKDKDVVIETDVITASQPFDGIEVRAEGVAFDALSLATPIPAMPSQAYAGDALELPVPARSQYVVDAERGWCSPATLCMLHTYYGHDHGVERTAQNVFDSAYNGTGNWAFNVAFSGTLGLTGVVAYLRNLDHAATLIAHGVPLGLSYSWQDDELPGAPLAHSDGHLVALCGFTNSGDCIVNDPAVPEVRITYPRAALESIWLRNKGVAFVVARPDRDIETLINA
ncbi:MAG: hypothetical protein NVSMB31_20220 [Vulcanimicrobiaceae bacterium]